jgi:hypothetical protein
VECGERGVLVDAAVAALAGKLKNLAFFCNFLIKIKKND